VRELRILRGRSVQTGVLVAEFLLVVVLLLWSLMPWIPGADGAVQGAVEEIRRLAGA
jgi:hypothetical protein